MSTAPVTRDVLLAPADNVRLVELCGPLDENLRLLEVRLDERRVGLADRSQRSGFVVDVPDQVTGSRREGREREESSICLSLEIAARPTISR